MESTGLLNINISLKNDELTFTTSNSYTKSNKIPGIGLKNIKQQLQHFYPESFQLNIENNNIIFKVELKIDLS